MRAISLPVAGSIEAKVFFDFAAWNLPSMKALPGRFRSRAIA